MRNGVEESVCGAEGMMNLAMTRYGAEGMMSLAMTRALMEDEDAGKVHLGWGGAEDPWSIEANALLFTPKGMRSMATVVPLLFARGSAGGDLWVGGGMIFDKCP